MKALNDLRSSLAEDGMRWTRPRQRVLEMLAKSSLPMSVKDLHVLAGEEGIDVASVYRTVRLLCRRGIAVLVDVGNSGARYEVSDRYRAHHHHVVCRSCGLTRDISGCGAEKWAERVEKETGFKGLLHQINFTGLCSNCA